MLNCHYTPWRARWQLSYEVGFWDIPCFPSLRLYQGPYLQIFVKGFFKANPDYDPQPYGRNLGLGVLI